MKCYIGLDVSMKRTFICAVDEQGRMVHESAVATNPDTLAEAIKKIGPSIELVGLESGSLSHFLHRELANRDLNVVCVDARKMNAILSIRVNKTDKNDARGIADALRTGMFTRVHEKPRESIDRGAVLATRRCLVNQRTDIKNHIRGILKTYGICLGAIGPTKFSSAVKVRITDFDHIVTRALEGALAVFDSLTEQLAQLDQELLAIAQQDKIVRLLMTAHGVGPITALTYKAEIHNPRRFKDSRAVGAYLGMTPKQYSSGDTVKQGRISKCGSNELRSLLGSVA